MKMLPSRGAWIEMNRRRMAYEATMDAPLAGSMD